MTGAVKTAIEFVPVLPRFGTYTLPAASTAFPEGWVKPGSASVTDGTRVLLAVNGGVNMYSRLLA